MIRNEQSLSGVGERVSVLLSTCPEAEAERLATFLVEHGHAACVNIVPRVTSVYRWEGKVQREAESLLVVKVRTDRLAQVTRALVDEHPYDVPEVVALEVCGGNQQYLTWVLENTKGR